MEFEEIAKRVKEITKNVENIVNEEIFTLKYFDNKNYEKNKQTLKKVLLDKPLIFEGKAVISGLYWAERNTLYIHDKTFSAELLLHEIIHMLSADCEKQIIGYAKNDDLFKFNEAATQWLVLKALHGNDIAKAPSLLYGEEVQSFDQLVELIGEEKMFSGFFEANFDKLKETLNENEKQILDNVINELNVIEKSKVC